MSITRTTTFGWIGCAVAFTLSWMKWHIVWLAIVHGLFCGWVYVIYYVFKYL